MHICRCAVCTLVVVNSSCPQDERSDNSLTPKDAADAYAQEMMAIEEGGEVEDLW